MRISSEIIAVWEAKCDEIEAAFKQAQVGISRQIVDTMPYACVTAWLNYGYGGQRQAIVTIDQGMICRVFLSALYDVPDGLTVEQVRNGVGVPLSFTVPSETPNLGNEIVRLVRDAMFRE